MEEALKLCSKAENLFLDISMNGTGIPAQWNYTEKLLDKIT